MSFPQVELPVQVECDACGFGLRVVLTQAKWPLAYFSEKLSDPKLNYSTYDKEYLRYHLGFYILQSLPQP